MNRTASIYNLNYLKYTHCDEIKFTRIKSNADIMLWYRMHFNGRFLFENRIIKQFSMIRSRKCFPFHIILI